jgi:hypothetical protein
MDIKDRIDKYWPNNDFVALTDSIFNIDYNYYNECRNFASQYEKDLLEPLDVKNQWYIIHQYRHMMSRILTRVGKLERELEKNGIKAH